MSIAALIRRMADAGASPEAIAIAVEAIEATQGADAERRAKAAERKARQRAKERDSHATVTGRDRDRGVTPSPKKETSPTPPKEKTTPSSSEAKASSLNPRGELEIVLDAERAGAVLDHRQRIGKPLTAHAAKLLAGKLALCTNPNAAADEMISNGWQGFKPEWIEGRNTRQTTAPPKPKSIGDMFREDARQMGIIPNDQPTHSPDRRLVESDRAGEGSGSGISRRFAIPSNVLGNVGSG